jgi:CRP/FNR family transcriptional regulator
LVFSRQRLLAGHTLYRKGDAFGLVHAVRSGSLKSSLTLADGRTQVSSFHLPGDVLGLDGVANGRHQTTATAMEDTQTCTLAYGPLLELALRLPLVQQDLARLMSREVCAAQWHMLLLGSMSAPERMAALLLDLSRRAAARGHSPREFNLRMTRSDIGSYLGITAETVCRVLQGFKALKLLEVDARHIRFLDLPTFARTYSATVHWCPGNRSAGPPALRTPMLAEQTRLTPP